MSGCLQTIKLSASGKKIGYDDNDMEKLPELHCSKPICFESKTIQIQWNTTSTDIQPSARKHFAQEQQQPIIEPSGCAMFWSEEVMDVTQSWA